MSEIKVGDIVKVNGWVCKHYRYNVPDFLDAEKDLLFISDGKAIIKAIVDCITLIKCVGIDYEWVAHIKQCRKPVKKKKCKSCNGFGAVMSTVENFSYICGKCNGTGKV